METRLTDLDALCQAVRDPLSQSYIDEAINAYRAGSLKAAIVSTWVAVTFDIIAKIKELANGGDKQAVAFVTSLDANVISGNVAKLLEMEGRLLEIAEKKFEFIDPISRRHFKRLQDDRHLCAHPAFTADGQLFTPRPELVRSHIVEAVHSLLALRPVMGKAVLDLFDRDFKSVSFPTAEQDVTRFVASRYLANTKAGAHVSLGAVLAKAILKASPAGWEGRIALLPAALQAIRDSDPAVWKSSILKQLASLIDAADDTHLPNAFMLLTRFEDLRLALNETANTRLKALIQSITPNTDDIRPFEAVGLPTFGEMVVSKFDGMAWGIKIAILTRFPDRHFWPSVIKRFAAASSYRAAEIIMTNLIMPLRSGATPAEVTSLLETVTSNNQIWPAAGIPEALASFVRTVGTKYPLTPHDAQAFEAVLEKKGALTSFADALGAFGIVVPPRPIDEELAALLVASTSPNNAR